jgi:hypothetical protein
VRDNSASSGRKARKTLTDTGKGMAGPEGTEPSLWRVLFYPAILSCVHVRFMNTCLAGNTRGRARQEARIHFSLSNRMRHFV